MIIRATRKITTKDYSGDAGFVDGNSLYGSYQSLRFLATPIMISKLEKIAKVGKRQRYGR
jgi:hypothetical protein